MSDAHTHTHTAFDSLFRSNQRAAAVCLYFENAYNSYDADLSNSLSKQRHHWTCCVSLRGSGRELKTFYF
eukprot:gene7487-5274_t